MQVILWDIDGTLLASGGAGKVAYESALVEEFGLEGVRAQVPYSGRTDRAIARDLFLTHDVADTPANFEKLTAGYFERLPRALAERDGRVLPGVRELLAALGERGGVLQGLLTGNTRRGAELKLRHFGLWERFAFGGFGDAHLNRDDVARDALAAACAVVGGDCGGRLWVVGDTPHDITCGRAIGAKVLAVVTGWHTAEALADAGPDLLLPDLTDPSAWLELLFVDTV